MKQKKEKIAITINSEILKVIDDYAEFTYQSRSAAIDDFLVLGIKMYDSLVKGGIDHGKVTIC